MKYLLLLSVCGTLKRNPELNQVVLLVACFGKEILTLILSTRVNACLYTGTEEVTFLPDSGCGSPGSLTAENLI